MRLMHILIFSFSILPRLIMELICFLDFLVMMDLYIYVTETEGSITREGGKQESAEFLGTNISTSVRMVSLITRKGHKVGFLRKKKLHHFVTKSHLKLKSLPSLTQALKKKLLMLMMLQL